MASERRQSLAIGGVSNADLAAVVEMEVIQTVPELAALSADLRHQLLCHLADAVAFAKVGLPKKRSDLKRSSDRKCIFANDIAAAMSSIGLRVAVWNRSDEGKSASLYVRVLQASAQLADIKIADRPFKLRKEARELQCARISLDELL